MPDNDIKHQFVTLCCSDTNFLFVDELHAYASRIFQISRNDPRTLINANWHDSDQSLSSSKHSRYHFQFEMWSCGIWIFTIETTMMKYKMTSTRNILSIWLEIRSIRVENVSRTTMRYRKLSSTYYECQRFQARTVEVTKKQTCWDSPIDVQLTDVGIQLSTDMDNRFTVLLDPVTRKSWFQHESVKFVCSLHVMLKNYSRSYVDSEDVVRSWISHLSKNIWLFHHDWNNKTIVMKCPSHFDKGFSVRKWIVSSDELYWDTNISYRRYDTFILCRFTRN